LGNTREDFRIELGGRKLLTEKVYAGKCNKFLRAEIVRVGRGRIGLDKGKREGIRSMLITSSGCPEAAKKKKPTAGGGTLGEKLDLEKTINLSQNPKQVTAQG